MLDSEIKEYLSKAGIRKISALDTALIEAYGQEEGQKHIERLTELFDLSEERLLYGTGNTPYLHRQEELVDYLNQSLQMSLLAASFYDRVFFRRVMAYLNEHNLFGTDKYLGQQAGEIFDIGCGNGILTCFLALQHPGASVTGLELSRNAVLVAEELAGKLQAGNVCFAVPGTLPQKRCDMLFSCRTAHENVMWRALREEADRPALSAAEQAKRHEGYAKKLSALVKHKGYLVSVERYGDDDAYAGLVHALEHSGFCQVKGTHMQFSCRNGDGMAVFQAIIMQKADM